MLFRKATQPQPSGKNETIMTNRLQRKACIGTKFGVLALFQRLLCRLYELFGATVGGSVLHNISVMHVMVQRRLYSCSQALLQVLLIPGLLKLPRGNCPQHVIFCTSNPFGIRQWCSARWSRDSELPLRPPSVKPLASFLLQALGCQIPSTFAFTYHGHFFKLTQVHRFDLEGLG